MDLLKSISGWFGSIETGIGDVVDWFVGTDSGMGEDYGTPGVISKVFGYEDSFLGSSVASAAGKLLLGSNKEKEDDPKDYLLPLGAAPGTVSAQRGQSRFVGQNNTALRSAMNRLASRTNVNPDTARLANMYLTKRQGQRTLGVGSPTMSRVSPAKAASVRAESKSVGIA